MSCTQKNSHPVFSCVLAQGHVEKFKLTHTAMNVVSGVYRRRFATVGWICTTVVPGDRPRDRPIQTSGRARRWFWNGAHWYYMELCVG